MPRAARRTIASDTTTGVSTSYGYSYSNDTAYNRHAESQPGPSNTSASRITVSISALLKALDEPTSTPSTTVKGNGKKRSNASTATGDHDLAGGKSRAKRRKNDKEMGGEVPRAPSPEKRGAVTRSKPPRAIIERVERVVSQRFFLIDRWRNEDELREEFSVLGSTGNVYTVTIDKRPSCTCPDAMKGNHCKHILFVFCKVLQVPQSSQYWYQKALLTSELEEVFRKAPAAPNEMANARVREAYERATGRNSSSSSTQRSRRVPGAEDDCPVCYENMHGAQESSLTWCEACGNALHKECFQQWAKKRSGTPDCVYCRAPWAGAGARNAGSSSRSEGYVNLAGVAGLSPVRDTTSYYHGPRRGQHYYGYQDYDD